MAAAPEVTWLGHASVLVRAGTARLLFDPVVRPGLMHLRRRGRVDPAHLVDIDAVFVSHAHHDHLDVASLRRIAAANPDVIIHAPTGAAGVLRRLRIATVLTVAVGERIVIGDATVEVTFVEHGGDRTGPRRDEAGAEAVSFVVQSPDGTRVWFAGDTELVPELAAIGPVDVALVPVGGWWRTLGPGHMDPDQAAQAVELVGARVAIPIHWGTFYPLLLRSAMLATWRDVPTAFTRACERLERPVRVEVLEPGQTTTPNTTTEP